MKYAFLSFLIILFLSCGRKTVPQNTKEREERSEWLTFLAKEFKLVTFKDCLKYGTGGEISACSGDISQQMDYPLGQDGYALADSLAQIIGKLVKEDSVYQYENFLSKDPDNPDLRGRRVFKFCLEYYSSTELDSIVKERYKLK